MQSEELPVDGDSRKPVETTEESAEVPSVASEAKAEELQNPSGLELDDPG